MLILHASVGDSVIFIGVNTVTLEWYMYCTSYYTLQ